MKDIDKDNILYLVNKALECQFWNYSWDNMIDDALTDCTPEERQWAKENIGYKAYITEE